MNLNLKLIDAIYREQHLLTRLSPVDRSVFHALAYYMNDATGCQPTKATLARATGYASNTVARSLETLQRTGIIGCTKRRMPVSGTNLYTIKYVPDPDEPGQRVILQPSAPRDPPRAEHLPGRQIRRLPR